MLIFLEFLYVPLVVPNGGDFGWVDAHHGVCPPIHKALSIAARYLQGRVVK